MKTLRNEQATDDCLKIFDYAVAPDGGLEEALQLAEAVECKQFIELVKDIDSIYESILAATTNEATQRQYNGKLHILANFVKQNIQMPTIRAEAENDKGRVINVLKHYKNLGGYIFNVDFFAKICYLGRTSSGLAASPMFWKDEKWLDGTPVHDTTNWLWFNHSTVVECLSNNGSGLYLCQRIADGVAQGVIDVMRPHGYEGIENITVYTNLPNPSNIVKFKHIITTI